MAMQILDDRRNASGDYKVDVRRGERVGRVSSEWFSRPDDERILSLSDRHHRLSRHWYAEELDGQSSHV